jgi:hypothetical protein
MLSTFNFNLNPIHHFYENFKLTFMFDFYFYPVLKFISAKGQKRTKDKKGQRTKKGQNKSAPWFCLGPAHELS